MLYSNINYISTDPDYKVFCNVYRSTEENGTYEKISNIASVNCMDNVGMVDENLKSNTTYYYKAIVALEGATKYSDIIKVTTKKASTTISQTPVQSNNSSNKTNEIENPKTGTFFPLLIVTFMTVISFSIFRYSRKKSLFIKI